MTDETSATTPLPAAARMRRSRQRRRDGVRCVPIEINDAEVEALIVAGLLDPVTRNDPEAIGVAVGKLLERLPAEQAGTDATRVYLKVSGGFVNLLVSLGWLRENHRNDPTALRAALTGFASRAASVSLRMPAAFQTLGT